MSGRTISLALAVAVVCAIAPGSAHAQDVPTMTATVLSPDSIPIAYESHGEGAPALVFVHGWSCDRSYWEGQLELEGPRRE